MLLFLFLTITSILWSSIFGYVAVLLAVTAYRRSIRPELFDDVPDDDLPAIAVVVPVRNEERYIAARLADLRRSSYPANRIAIVVVDGGSSDATISLLEAERERRAGLTLVRVHGARGKAEQLNAVLGALPHDIVVVTDADVRLEPGCIPALVGELRRNPGTDIVGARVRPATQLLEERLHWWVLNSLWWLEGEAFGNGQVSGVCYALRSRAVATLPADCIAEDIHFGLLASARGREVRLCRRAVATELRVPQTALDFLKFRRRRGAGYIHELRRTRPDSAPLRWQVMQAVRLYHFFVMPALAATTAATGLVLLSTPQWHWPLVAAVAFAVPATLALFASTTLGEDRPWWRLGLAAGRLAGLTLYSLLALPRAAMAKLAKGD